MGFSRKAFYDSVRTSLFGGALSQSAVDNMNAVLDYWFENHAAKPAAQLAYILGTMRHEVGANMAPVRETFATSDAQARARLAKRKYGKPAGPFGHVYYGRGYVQLTWHDNYKRQAEKLGLDLVEHPDLVLRSDIAVRILVEGMLDGDFTGVGLNNFITAGSQDFFNARKIVNKLDRAELIAGYAKKFLTAIQAASNSSDDFEFGSGIADVPDFPDPVQPDFPQNDFPMPADGDRQRELLAVVAALVQRLSTDGKLDPQVRQVLPVLLMLLLKPEGLDASKLQALAGAAVPVPDDKVLTPVNNAFGETIGKLFNGRKTGLGILGTLAAFLLGGTTGAPTLDASNAGSVLGPLLGAVGGASPVILPITLALTAGGMLGKIDKWVAKK
jgi:putative chitinase